MLKALKASDAFFISECSTFGSRDTIYMLEIQFWELIVVLVTHHSKSSKAAIKKRLQIIFKASNNLWPKSDTFDLNKNMYSSFTVVDWRISSVLIEMYVSNFASS